MKILSKILTLLTIILFSSCGIEKMEFDKSKWNERLDGFYEYRENMVEDLMQNHLKKGMDYKGVVELLGEPIDSKNNKTNEISYEIMVDYGWNIDPMEGEVLYLEFEKDSTLIKSRLEHWEH